MPQPEPLFRLSFEPDRVRLDAGPPDAAWWVSVAKRMRDWAGARGVSLQDAVWLLPYAALLPPARAALAAVGGWQPRVETLATWRAQLAPRAGAAGPSGDAVLDRLQAAQWLREQPSLAAWAKDDPRAFRQGVDALVRCAQGLQAAATAQPPERRDAWWSEVRAAVSGGEGPGSIERLLARVALEWAASGSSMDADLLRAQRPSAWLMLRAGGTDPLGWALMSEAAAGGIPCLCLDADPPDEEPFALALSQEPPAEALCADAEAEAQAACAQVLAELRNTEGVVGLIAQDREGTRRVRALLERFGVSVVDDTGWRLATTRAAARLVALLRAAQGLRPGRGDATAADQRLDWLKDDPLGLGDAEGLLALEAIWRGRRVGEGGQARADALWEVAQGRLAPLLAERRRTLLAWTQQLAALCLAEDAQAARWRDDAAGRALLQALRLDAPASQAPGWLALASRTAMTLDDFVAWVDEVLAEASFVPPHDPQARVVIAPLARALLRPFAAVVFAGTDERRFGDAEPQPELIAPAHAARLGIDGQATQRQRELLAFGQLLRQPRVTLLRSVAEGSEPLGASPLVERLRLAWASAAPPRALRRVAPSLPQRQIVATPVASPLPRAGARWPDALSASAVEALRACPYRFYSRVLLGLGEAEELDREVAKREYGNWLHAVLFRFHEGRTPGEGLAADRARLHAAARAEIEASPHGEADLLPFLASFETLVEPYLAWLHAREAAGWVWWQGEQDRSVAPPALGGLRLRGRLDRLDRAGDGRLQLLDYKTGSAARLKSQVSDRTEDTQLAFYAALLGGDEGVPPDGIGAAYLAVDGREAPMEIAHKDVGATAQLLVDHLADELRRLKEGEPLQALGQGELCEHCEARGLCRRDQWAAMPQEPAE
jgi:ATP-dependent helicase/nuclease subunit B